MMWQMGFKFKLWKRLLNCKRQKSNSKSSAHFLERDDLIFHQWGFSLLLKSNCKKKKQIYYWNDFNFLPCRILIAAAVRAQQRRFFFWERITFFPGLFDLKYYIWGVLSYVKAALWECLKINLGKYWRHKIFPLPAVFLIRNIIYCRLAQESSFKSNL